MVYTQTGIEGNKHKIQIGVATLGKGKLNFSDICLKLYNTIFRSIPFTTTFVNFFLLLCYTIIITPCKLETLSKAMYLTIFTVIDEFVSLVK